MSGIDASMFELFREEVRAHADTLAGGLIALEASPTDPGLLEGLMRAAHSIKGAARIIGIDTAVRIAHVMEDALVAAQAGRLRLGPPDVDALLKGTDVLAGLAELSPDTVAAWEETNGPAVGALEPVFVAMAAGKTAERPEPTVPAALPLASSEAKLAPRSAAPESVTGPTPAGSPFPAVPAFTPPNLPAEPFVLGPAHSVLDLFREETRGQLSAVATTLPAVATDPTAADRVVEAFKQVRGAARLVKCAPVATLAHAIGGFWRSAREGKCDLSALALDWTRYAVAALAGVLATDDDGFPAWAEAAQVTLGDIAEAFARAADVPAAPREAPVPVAPQAPPPPAPFLPDAPASGPGSSTEVGSSTTPPSAPAPVSPAPAEPVVRVTAQSLNRLMGLAGESLVQARWLPTFSTALLKLRKQHDVLAAMLDTAFHAAAGGAPPPHLAELIALARRQWATCRQELTAKTGEFDDHSARAEDLNARLYREVIASRMRPFADGAHGFPRLVRDMARALGKEARLVVVGERTEVDRDILEKLESPLAHLIRNAVDHGLEEPEGRAAAGKSAAGTIALEARHRAGMLHVTVADDGAGIDPARLRRKVVERGLSTAEVAARLTEAELLEFLFLPGFSTAANVTEFSGRGVGLDVVQDTVRKVGGNVRVTTAAGRGTTFHLQLPLTLSVIRAVVVDVAGEPYAFPHTRIDRLLRVHRSEVRSIEHRQFVTVDGQNVGLVMAGQLLDIPAPTPATEELPVVLLGDGSGAYGLVVDAFRGEQDLVVRPLDARLGKVPNLSAAAILDDGAPVLIVDVEDLLRSMDQYIQSGSLVRCETRPGTGRKKRVLVVDDSITVREVERQLLLHKGYDVAVAVDGVDGWNKVRAERYDLMVSDIDMPRMNGLQLVQAVRADERLRDLPVVIVSYKEREEDRMRGLEVGANAYLTKSSFHDNRFMEAVVDLIGPAEGG
jgi:two-component system sensor histidine kinase and response regulator WspE